MSTQYIVVSLILRSKFLNHQKKAEETLKPSQKNLLANPTVRGRASTLAEQWTTKPPSTCCDYRHLKPQDVVFGAISPKNAIAIM